MDFSRADRYYRTLVHWHVASVLDMQVAGSFLWGTLCKASSF